MRANRIWPTTAIMALLIAAASGAAYAQEVTFGELIGFEQNIEPGQTFQGAIDLPVTANGGTVRVANMTIGFEGDVGPDDFAGVTVRFGEAPDVNADFGEGAAEIAWAPGEGPLLEDGIENQLLVDVEMSQDARPGSFFTLQVTQVAYEEPGIGTLGLPARGWDFIVVGDGGGGGYRITLHEENPADESANPGEQDVLVFRFDLEAEFELTLQVLEVELAGTADNQDLGEVLLFEEGEPQPLDEAVFNGEGVARFDNLQTMLPEARLGFEIRVDISAGADAGDTVIMEVTDLQTWEEVPLDLVNIPGNESATITIQNPGAGAELTASGVSVQPQSIAAGTQHAVALVFDAEATGEDPVTITDFRFTASGSGHDANDLTNLRLVRDLNDDGEVALNEPVLGSGQFNADNGELVIEPSPVVLDNSERARFILTASLGQGVAPGLTYSIRLNHLELEPNGAQTLGLPVVAGTITVRQPIALTTISDKNAGDISIRPGRHLVGRFGIDVTRGPSQLLSIFLRAQGSGDDTGMNVELVLDRDRNGLVNGVDEVMPARAYDGDDGLLQLSLGETTLQAGQGLDLLVFYDIPANAPVDAQYGFRVTMLTAIVSEQTGLPVESRTVTVDDESEFDPKNPIGSSLGCTSSDRGTPAIAGHALLLAMLTGLALWRRRMA